MHSYDSSSTEAGAGQPAHGDAPAPDFSSAVRFYGRRLAGASAPFVVHLHGGGFCGGSLDSGETVGRIIAAAGAVVASIDYPTAPGQHFPAQAEAAYAALQWAARKQRRLAGPDSRLFVAGEEAGGNLAAAAAVMARDRHGPDLAGQMLFSPMLDPTLGTASQRRCAMQRALDDTAEGWRQYLSCPCDASHPYAAPGLATRVTGLPPTLLVLGHDDPMDDEARAYGRRLAAAGVMVDTLHVSQAHGWPAALAQRTDTLPDWSTAVAARLFSFMTSAALAHRSVGG
jgi:acetyl esterase/lipase